VKKSTILKIIVCEYSIFKLSLILKVNSIVDKSGIYFGKFLRFLKVDFTFKRY